MSGIFKLGGNIPWVNISRFVFCLFFFSIFSSVPGGGGALSIYTGGGVPPNIGPKTAALQFAHWPYIGPLHWRNVGSIWEAKHGPM